MQTIIYLTADWVQSCSVGIVCMSILVSRSFIKRSGSLRDLKLPVIKLYRRTKLKLAKLI